MRSTILLVLIFALHFSSALRISEVLKTWNGTLRIIHGTGQNIFLYDAIRNIRHRMQKSLLSVLSRGGGIIIDTQQLPDDTVLAIPLLGEVIDDLKPIAASIRNATRYDFNMSSQSKVLLKYEECIIRKMKWNNFESWKSQSDCLDSQYMFPPANLPLTCTFGYGMAPNVPAVSGSTKYKGCKTRYIHERGYVHQVLNATLGSMVNNKMNSSALLQMLVERGISNLFFVGDSITIQLGKALACDLYRLGFKFETEKNHDFFYEYKIAGTKIIYNATHNLDFLILRGIVIHIHARVYSYYYSQITLRTQRILVFHAHTHMDRRLVSAQEMPTEQQLSLAT